MNNSNIRLLLCEADTTISLFIADALRQAGYEVGCAYSDKEAMRLLLEKSYDVCLLDIATTAINKMDFVRGIRQNGIEIPMIAILERDDTDYIISAYEAGCDDYIVRPFAMALLLCKLQVITRLQRRRDEDNRTEFDLGGMQFDAVKQKLGERELSAHENELLLLLCRNMGKTVDRSTILRQIWHNDDYFASRSLSVYIHRLRSYLKQAKEGEVQIISARGKGYKLF